MIPILFSNNASSFPTQNHGLGDLMETISCESVVNAEGEYELELEYPAGGEMINQLVINNIIYAKVNDHGNWQAFRIYGIDKAINNLVTVHAQHISYDLSGVVVKAYEKSTCSQAVAGLKTNAVGSYADPFTFTTDVTAPAHTIKGTFKLEEPDSLRAVLLDGDNSIKGTFGGDLLFDNYTVSLLSVGGADRGVLIEYGIDLIDMEQEESISEMVTGVFPYWKGTEEGAGEEKIVYGDVQYASGTFQRHRIVPLNVAEYYPNNKSAPSVSDINKTARDWIAAEEIGQPEINLTLSYAELPKNKDVRLHDAVTVRFVNIGIDVKAKVVSYRYDVLKERCIEVEVGNVKPSILFSLEDASRLKRGLLPPERIQNNSIGSAQIGASAVSSYHLTDAAVGETKIENGAVTEGKIGEMAVTEGKIGPLAVAEAHIQNSAVTNGKIGNAAITSEKIGEGEIKTANIGDAAVVSAHIHDGAVTDFKIYNGDDPLLQLNGAKLRDASVNTLQIGDNAITSMKIKDGEVVNAKIYNGKNPLLQLDGAKLKEASVNTLQIGDSAITSTKIKDGEVVDAKIYSGDNELLQLNGEKIKELSINSAQIGNSAITSLKINDGAVIDGKIGDYAINYENIKDAEIDQLKLNDFSITSAKLDGNNGNPSRRQRPDGTWVDISPAVVTMKIGANAVADVKLSENAQGAIAAIWEIDDLVTDNINTQGITIGGYNVGFLAKDGYRYVIAI